MKNEIKNNGPASHTSRAYLSDSYLIKKLLSRHSKFVDIWLYTKI